MRVRSRSRAIAWTVAAVAISVALYLAALNSDFYNLTSPPEFELHVVLRKLYSVGAFALVAFLIARALREFGVPIYARGVVFIGAAYSGAIEIGQFANGGTEGLAWNAFDVGCGALGGVLAAWVPGGSRRGVREIKRKRLARPAIRYRTVQVRDEPPARIGERRNDI